VNPADNPLKRAIVREHRIKFLFFVSSIVLLGMIVIKVDNMMVSLILGIATFYLLAPVVDFLERRGLSRLMATTAPFVILIGVQILLLSLLIPVLWDQLKNLQMNGDRYLETLNSGVDQLQTRLSLILGGFSGAKSQTNLGAPFNELGNSVFSETAGIPFAVLHGAFFSTFIFLFHVARWPRFHSALAQFSSKSLV
jgi:predicted PurR-regulated permease PerM